MPCASRKAWLEAIGSLSKTTGRGHFVSLESELLYVALLLATRFICAEFGKPGHAQRLVGLCVQACLFVHHMKQFNICFLVMLECLLLMHSHLALRVGQQTSQMPSFRGSSHPNQTRNKLLHSPFCPRALSSSLFLQARTNFVL